MNFPEFVRQYGQLIKPGDALVVMFAGVITLGLFVFSWAKPVGEHVVVYSQGRMVIHADLSREADYEVSGKLGQSRIEVRHGRARVASDPGPRQICVRQGWIGRTGEAALCLANQVSVEIGGTASQFDSRSY